MLSALEHSALIKKFTESEDYFHEINKTDVAWDCLSNYCVVWSFNVDGRLCSWSDYVLFGNSCGNGALFHRLFYKKRKIVIQK